MTPERRALPELLSRFALTAKQAQPWFEPARCNAATTQTVSDREMIDDPAVPVPEQFRVDSPGDRRRVRGAVVAVLRRAAENGDSLLSTVEALTRLERLDLARPGVVPLDWFAAKAGFLDAMAKQIDVEVPTAEAQGTQQQLSALQQKTCLGAASRSSGAWSAAVSTRAF